MWAEGQLVYSRTIHGEQMKLKKVLEVLGQIMLGLMVLGMWVLAYTVAVGLGTVALPQGIWAADQIGGIDGLIVALVAGLGCAFPIPLALLTLLMWLRSSDRSTEPGFWGNTLGALTAVFGVGSLVLKGVGLVTELSDPRLQGFVGFFFCLCGIFVLGLSMVIPYLAPQQTRKKTEPYL